MQKFFLFFVKKLLTKFLSHSIISNVSGTRQNTKEYARVAQLVEHDLAKVGAAGSSPVSRSLLTKRTSDGCPFLLNRVLPDQVVRGLRSAPVGAEQTSTGRLAPSRALLLKALAISG